MNKYLMMVLFFSLSYPVYASVSCGANRVTGVQIRANGDVYYTNNTGDLSRKAGNLLKNPVTQYMVPTLLTAVEKRLLILASYPDGYDCKASALDIPAEWIAVQDPNQ